MRIHQITVLRDQRRIQMTVEMPDLSRYLTSQVPNLPRQLFRVLPSMAKHTCHNDNGVSFRKECRSTEIPHLFEHIVLELQGQSQDMYVLRGETRWNWHETPRGYFTVSVDYDNELLVIAAIKLAERIVQSLDDHSIDALDMPVEIARLREIARIGRELDIPTWVFSAGNRSGVADAQTACPRLVQTLRRRATGRRAVPPATHARRLAAQPR